VAAHGASLAALYNHFSLYYIYCVNTIEALGAPRRREILRLVWQQERSAGDLHRALGDVTFGAVSQHLRILSDSGLLLRREEGRKRFYRAQKEALGPLQEWLETMWSDALYRLKIRAEMEQARRGPLPQKRRRRR
jgi:DNA-binding transcriptional ArsR family regulator